MKLIIVIVFIIITSKISSQNICGEIIYHTKTYTELNYLMTFNNKASYNEEMNVKIEKDTEKITINSGKQTTNINFGRKSLEPNFYYNNNKDFYFSHEYIDGEIDIIRENRKIWKWKILSNTKKIGNFICQKATTTFRGSKFTAWFTHEIPVPFGPWKAKDLPGLILELYDSKEIIHIFTEKITIFKNNNKNCILLFDEIVVKKGITIKNYLKKEQKKLQEYVNKLNSKRPKGSKPQVLAKDCDDCPNQQNLENFNEKN
jgi:GLPGLI family protein